jgi:rod shape-determining protein MreC
MESFFARYRNVTVLLVLLMAQVIVLASQVRRPATATRDSMSLMRLWVVEVFVPGEKALSSVGSGLSSVWKSYIDLRGVRTQNRDLQGQLDRLRLEQVRLAEDSGQLRRLQSLLAFKEKFVAQTVAAQVIGTSGSEHSHVLYIDKGSSEGIKADMAVITPQGIIGKIAKVFPGSSQVLELNDATAGAGVMLERSRLRGVMRGTPSGIPEIMHVMADEKVEAGEAVVSSGGDQIYPRGLPIGTVSSTVPDPEGGPFMVVKVKPTANLDKVEEVLVITKIGEKEPEQQQTATTLRAADILAQRLPTVTPKPPEQKKAEPPSTAVLYGRSAAKPPANAASGVQPGSPSTSAQNGSGTPATPPKKAVKPAEAAGESQPTESGSVETAPQSPTPKTEQPKASAPTTPTNNPPAQENPR